MTKPAAVQASQSAELQAVPDFDIDLHLPQIINTTMGAVNDQLNAALQQIDLPLPHWRLIAILKARPHCTLSDVSALTVIEMSTLSRAVRRLEAEGLVLRGTAPEDSRRMALSLTPYGEEVFARAWVVVSNFYAYLFAEVTPEDAAALRRVMKNLRERVARRPWDPA